jgi:hypothetical protein
MSPMRPRFAVLCGGAAAPASPPALPARGRLRALPAAADLDLDIVVTYRAQEAERIGKHGRKLRPHSVLDSHKALFTFLRWARTRRYEFDPSILELKRLRVPKPEADVYHMSQLRALLSRCRRRLSRLGGPSGGLGGGATAWGRARSPAGPSCAGRRHQAARQMDKLDVAHVQDCTGRDVAANHPCAGLACDRATALKGREADDSEHEQVTPSATGG